MSLVGYWKLNETSGDVVKDDSGNGYDGLVSPTGLENNWVAGHLNNAFNCAAQQIINIDSTPLLEYDFNLAWSWSFWVKTTNSNNAAIIRKEGNFEDPGYRIILNGSRLDFKIMENLNNHNIRLEDGGVIDGNWHHIVITASHDGGLEGFKIYVDNILRSTSVVTGGSQIGSILTSNPTKIGYSTWTGALDAIRMYNHELSVEEIDVLFNEAAEVIAEATIPGVSPIFVSPKAVWEGRRERAASLNIFETKLGRKIARQRQVFDLPPTPSKAVVARKTQVPPVVPSPNKQEDKFATQRRNRRISDLLEG